MCGIVGFVGSRPAAPLLFEGLQKLEYRGYDSAGIATMGSGIHLVKEVGPVIRIEAAASLPGQIGIAHTRWATHGGVTKENAHPHLSNDGSIAVAHNGIIENFEELKWELEAGGFVFKSQTDTEVIPNLIQAGFTGNLREAICKAVGRLRGSFALLVMSSKEPGKIYAVRNESPLLVGLAADGVFVASDSMPFLHHTRDVVYLDDGEMAVAEAGGVSYFSFNGSAVQKQVQKANWDETASSLNGFKHYTIKEIMEQPASIKRVLNQDLSVVNEFADAIKSHRKTWVVACGTSRHAGLVGKHFINLFANENIEVMIASEFSSFADKLQPSHLVIAVSQSGETADVLAGVRKVKANGLKVFSIVNVAGSTLDRVSDKTLYLNCGPEIGVASTKAFLSQVALFYLIGYAMQNRLEEGAAKLDELSILVQKTLFENDAKARALAEKIKGHSSMYYIGRGTNFAIATEGALKIKEISYIHAEGMPAGELKHGTLALISQGVPVVSINPHDYTYYDSLSNATETKARGAFVIGVTDKHNSVFDEEFTVPKLDDELFYPFLTVLPLQLLAYYTALALGKNPDRPRNLAKSCTVK